MAGNTLWNIYNAIKKTAGICLGYIQGSIAVNIRAWLPNKGSKQTIKKISLKTIEQARIFGQKVYTSYQQLTSANKIENDLEKKPPKKFLLFFWWLFLTWNWQMMLTVGFKKVDKSKCIQCGLCVERICPSKAIKMDQDYYPKIIEFYCIGCNGCVNLCPTEAIRTRKTKGKKKYDFYKEFIFDEKYQ
jgi:Pyruvate/2-oxoacid:ferredoxin oxidoreductase delta subunit